MYFPQEPKCDPHPPQLPKQPCTPFTAKRFQPSLCMVHRSVQLHFSTLFRQKLWPTIMGKNDFIATGVEMGMNAVILESSLSQDTGMRWIPNLSCNVPETRHIIYIYIYNCICILTFAMLMMICLHWKGETSLDPDRLYYRSANFWVKSTFRSISKLSLNHTKPQMFP